MERRQFTREFKLEAVRLTKIGACPMRRRRKTLACSRLSRCILPKRQPIRFVSAVYVIRAIIGLRRSFTFYPA